MTIGAGCLLAFGSALLTSAMLFINGSLVFALLSAFASGGLSWASKPEVSQFLLFFLPVVLMVLEWKMIDYARSRFQQRPPH